MRNRLDLSRFAFTCVAAAAVLSASCQSEPKGLRPSGPGRVSGESPKKPDAPRPVAAKPSGLPEPHPDVPIGVVLTAYVGPRFITGDPFLSEAKTVLADETGRVRALLKGPPPPGLSVVRLPGLLAVPGLHDAHVHLQGIGQARTQVQLGGVQSPAEARARVAAWAQRNPTEPIVRGFGWDHSVFPGGAYPTWRDIEGVDSRPIVLSRVDGHASWVNRQALALAGITKDTKDPRGGQIVRDAQGEATGVLLDNAVALVESKLPTATPKDIERWLDIGLVACADSGLVAVHDQATSLASARVLSALDDAGELPLRVFSYVDGTDPAAYAFLGSRAPTERLRFMGVKLFADGALGSRGAALHEDYADAPGDRGFLVTAPEVLASRVAEAHAKGFSVSIHAIGDRGTQAALDALAGKGPARRAPDRIEHAQLVAAADRARLRELGVVASMQPTHVTSDMRWLEQRIGAKRLVGAYGWRAMIETGVMLAFGSDAPVEDVRPAWGIYAAVTRQDHQGAPPGGFLPDQRLSARQALAAFSAGAAYAVGLERELGALTPGMFFDVTLFSDDPLAATDGGDPKAWLTTRPVGTVVGGKLRPLR